MPSGCNCYLITLMFLSNVAQLCGGPVISFSAYTYDCGYVTEGETDTVAASFTVTNRGDADLRIEQVRPGCGCTAVTFDSLLHPGKSGNIGVRVALKGYGAGSLTKGIAVVSNAENEPVAHLTVTVTIRPVVGLSTSFLELVSESPAVPETVYLTTTKKEFTILSVQMRSDRGSVKRKIPFTFAPVDSVSEDGSGVFRLDLSAPVVDRCTAGTFEIRTNHQKARKVTVRGSICTM